MSNNTIYSSGIVQNHYAAYRDRADESDNKLAGGHGDSWGNRTFMLRKIDWLLGGYGSEIDITDEKYAGNKLMNEQGQYYTYGDNPIYSKDADGYWNTTADQARKTAAQKNKADEAKPEQEAEVQRRVDAAAAAKQQEEQKISNTNDQKNQSVQNAFNGSNNIINQGPNRDREEAVERAQEYQKNNNITTEVEESQKYQNNSSNQAVNNTEKSTTKSNSWNNDGFVQSLADEKLDEYKAKWRGDNKTNNYSNVFNNNINQNIGNKGNTTTNIGNSNKFYNTRAGNDYSLNFGNINLSNSKQT